MRSVALKAMFASLMIVCAVLPLFSTEAVPRTAFDQSSPEWPTAYRGKPLRPLALSEIDQRFARSFPGSIARMTTGEEQIVFRHVTRPTRMLHPAADCFRGLGYSVRAVQLEHDHEQRLLRCFTASKGDVRFRVCESIFDAEGQVFTDTSAWYWSAIMNQSVGPWRAVTVVTPM